jgi:hypothetical protein
MTNKGKAAANAGSSLRSKWKDKSGLMDGQFFEAE